MMVMHHRARRGLTLIELLVTIAIMALMAALVAPSFIRMIQAQRLRGVHDNLGTDLQFARAEAMRQRLPVHVMVKAKTATAPACYILFTDKNAIPPFSAACDCATPLGTEACANLATTKEIKRVQLDSATGVDFSIINDARYAIDPFSGAILLFVDDLGAVTGRSFIVDSSLDSTRVLRTVVGLAGHVRSCVPTGSTMTGAVAC